VIIYADETITNADVYGAGRLGYHIFLANSLLATVTSIPDYVPRTFVHELGHYLFSLLDEYRNRTVPEPATLLNCIHPAFSGTSRGFASCFMEDLDANVKAWCYVDNHEAISATTQLSDTWQSQDNDLLSCWSTMKRIFEGRSFFSVTEIPNDPAIPLTPPANPTYIFGQPQNDLVVAVDANMSATEVADMHLMLDALFAREPGPNSFVTFLSYHAGAPGISSREPWNTSLVALQGGVPRYRTTLSNIRPTTPMPNAGLQTLLNTALAQFLPTADTRTLLILTSGSESSAFSPPSGFLTPFLQIRTSIAFVKSLSSFSAPIVTTYTNLANIIAGRVYDATAENVIAYQAVESANKQLVCVETKLVASGKTEKLEFTLPGMIKEAMISASWRPTNNNCDARVSFNLTPDPGPDFVRIELPALQARRYFNLPAGTKVEISATTPDTCPRPSLPVTFAISDERPTVFLTATPERPRYGTDDNQVIHARVTNPHPLINVDMVAGEIDSLGEFRTPQTAPSDTLLDIGTSIRRYGDWKKDDGIYSNGFVNQTETGLRTLRVRATSRAQTKLAPGERFSNEPSNNAIPGFRREAFVTFFAPPLLTTLGQSTQIDAVKRLNPVQDTVLVAGHFNLPPDYPHLFDLSGNVMPSGGAQAPMKIDANTFTAKILVSPAVTAIPLTVETNFLYKTNDSFPDSFTSNFMITGIAAKPEDGGLLPQKFQLHPNYPNPFNLGTRLAFDLPKRSKISLGIYDVMGRQIRALIANEIYAAGVHQIEWDGRTDDGAIAGSGVYFVRLQAADQQWVNKILLMK
jgi:hypothetical protein